MNENIFDDNNFNESSEMSSLTIDFGKVTDYILGTFVRARHNVETQFGPNSIYEIMAERGQFHKLTKKVAADSSTTIGKGETWAVWGRGDIFCGQMNSLHPGQVVKLTFTEEKETKMGLAKIVKIYAPKNNEGKPMMNEQWLEDQSLMGGNI